MIQLLNGLARQSLTKLAHVAHVLDYNTRSGAVSWVDGQACRDALADLDRRRVDRAA